MSTTTKNKDCRNNRRKARQALFHKLDVLQAIGTDHKAIRDIGNKLDNLSKEKNIPSELTITSFSYLHEDRGWTKTQIRKHYGLKDREYQFFLENNGLIKTEILSNTISIEEYLVWVDSGKSDFEFCNKLGIDGSSLNLFKRDNGIPMKNGALIPPKKPGKPKFNLAIEQYHEYKSQELSDSTISRRIGTSIATLTNWKKKNNLSGHNLAQTKQNEEAVKSMQKLTVELYKDYQDKGLKDKEIANILGVTVGSIYQFKSVNKLSKTKNDLDKLERAEFFATDVKSDSAVTKVTNEMPVTETDWSPLRDTVKVYYENHSKKSSDLKSPEKVEIKNDDNFLKLEIQKLKEDALLQSQLRIQVEDQLMAASTRYINLDADFTNVKNENSRLTGMLEKLKETSLINLWLMKQHIGFVEQVDTLVDTGEVNNQWR